MTTIAEPTTTARVTAPPPLNPPERLLMGPGPSNPDPRVLAAMGANPVGHLDPYFVDLMDQTMGALRGVYRTANHHTLPISATGSAGLETIMMNLLEPGDSAVIGVVGYFGQRLAEMARRSGAEVRTVEVGPGEIVDPAQIEAQLEQKPAKLVAFVHVETTTGACQPIAPMVEVAKRYGALVAIDCVTSLGGVPLEIDALGVDAAGSCSQKCIGAPPGLAPITIGPRAMEAVRARKTKPSTWYLDLSLLFQYWGEKSGNRTRAFHHTAPIAAIYGFHEALRLILEEGLEARWARHQAAHEALVARARSPRAVALSAAGEPVRDDQRHQCRARRRRSEGASPSARHGCGDGRRPRRARRQGVARGRDGVQRAGAEGRAVRRRARGGVAFRGVE